VQKTVFKSDVLNHKNTEDTLTLSLCSTKQTLKRRTVSATFSLSLTATTKHSLGVSDLNADEIAASVSDISRSEFHVVRRRFIFRFAKVSSISLLVFSLYDGLSF
jgi:hypothetical protein